MRSPGVIYRRYRQAKKKILFDKISLIHQKSFENCMYGLPVDYKDNDSKSRTVKLCSFAAGTTSSATIDLASLDVCTCASKCNAFAPNKTKAQITHDFNEELKSPEIVLRKYPEVALMEWVLDNELEKAKVNMSPIKKLIVTIINFLERSLKL